MSGEFAAIRQRGGKPVPYNVKINRQIKIIQKFVAIIIDKLVILGYIYTCLNLYIRAYYQ